MRLNLLSWLVSAAIVALVAGCGGKVQTTSGSGGTGGNASGGSAGSAGSGTGGTGGGAPAPCDLSLIASGALPRKGKRIVESVAVAASSKAFTVAYVEQDPTDITLRNASLVDLGDNGQFGGVTRNDIPGCAGSTGSRGAAVTFGATGESGLAAFAVRNCGSSGAGSMFFSLSANSNPGAPKVAASNTFSALSFGSHALAGIAADRYAFVYLPTTVPAGGAQLATLTGDAFDGGAVDLFGAQPADAVAVSTSSSVGAVLGHLASGKEVLRIAAAGADAGAGSNHQLGTAPWGAVTALGSRVAVLLPTPGGLEYRLFNSSQQVQQHVLSGTPTPHGDITALGNRLIAVGAGAGAVSLYRIDNATGTPSPGVKVPTSLQVSSVREVAIAAARSTVAVVYTGNNTPGHWALFSCKN